MVWETACAGFVWRGSVAGLWFPGLPAVPRAAILADVCVVEDPDQDQGLRA